MQLIAAKNIAIRIFVVKSPDYPVGFDERQQKIEIIRV
jgi:hypothetical protein